MHLDRVIQHLTKATRNVVFGHRRVHSGLVGERAQQTACRDFATFEPYATMGELRTDDRRTVVHPSNDVVLAKRRGHVGVPSYARL